MCRSPSLLRSRRLSDLEGTAMLIRQADIVLCRILQMFQFIVRQGPDAPDRCAIPEAAPFQHLAGRYQ